jgi:hypothetical protein
MGLQLTSQSFDYHWNHHIPTLAKAGVRFSSFQDEGQEILVGAHYHGGSSWLNLRLLTFSKRDWMKKSIRYSVRQRNEWARRRWSIGDRSIVFSATIDQQHNNANSEDCCCCCCYLLHSFLEEEKKKGTRWMNARRCFGTSPCLRCVAPLSCCRGWIPEETLRGTAPPSLLVVVTLGSIEMIWRLPWLLLSFEDDMKNDTNWHVYSLCCLVWYCFP